jgi:phosphatidylserine/phosphatidylglycerophosphate/cardiolipin synthase-like enzyme
MSTALSALAVEVQGLADTLPREVILAVAHAIEQADVSNWSYARAKIVETVPQREFRALIDHLLQVWQATAREVVPQSVALALLTAAETDMQRRQAQTLELVWTGPDSHLIPLRRTDQVLLQIISEAQTRLTIVSFAVYQVEAIGRALVNAARRGVSIVMCLETPDASEGKVAFDTIKALGDEVRRYAKLYIWPLEQRSHSPAGKFGSLHAKVAIADGRAMFISSANLTEYAMTLNMELGVLVRGGELPKQVEEHFRTLIENGILKRIGTPV